MHLKEKSSMTMSDLLKAVHVHKEAESNLQDWGYYSSYNSKDNNTPMTNLMERRQKVILPR